MQTSAYHAIDPVTGFVETTGNYPAAFDGERKADFLKVYRASGLALYKTCEQLGLSRHTVSHHLQIDPAFSEAVEEAKRSYADELEAKSRNIALTRDSATLERIFQLRAIFPDKYARDLKQNGAQKIEINIVGDILMGKKRELDTVETSLVSEIDSADITIRTQLTPPTV